MKLAKRVVCSPIAADGSRCATPINHRSDSRTEVPAGTRSHSGSACRHAALNLPGGGLDFAIHRSAGCPS
jgi:hypothetical protein